MEEQKKIYSQSKKIKVGVGVTARTTEITNYFQAIESGEETINFQLLDLEDRPIGAPIPVSREEIAKDYAFHPEYFERKKKLKAAKIEGFVRAGDDHFQKSEYFSAEFEYGQALALNENHLRANLGKGKALSAMGEEEGSKKYFSRLSRIEALYEKENKHIFNELGIELRRKGMFAEAMINYRKAISIDPEDEVLYFNLARACFEMGGHERATEYLKTALRLKPDFTEASEWLAVISQPFSPSPLPAPFARPS